MYVITCRITDNEKYSAIRVKESKANSKFTPSSSSGQALSAVEWANIFVLSAASCGLLSLSIKICSNRYVLIRCYRFNK